MLKEYWDKVPSFLKNKYILTTILFFLWLLLFDQNDIISQIKLRAELNDLENQKEYYQNEIERVSKDLDELLTDDKKLEKFAREKYYMRKPNEDVFVFVEE